MNAAAKTNNRGLRVFTEVRKSPVLLLVIYNKNNATIEPDVIYEIFSKYGHVIKVLIFEKGTRTKAFIEFNTTEAASAAKIQMEGKLLFKDGTKASVFYATIDKIVFKNDSSAGKEYLTPDGTPMVISHVSATDPSGAKLFKEHQEHRLEAREIIEEAINENDDSYQDLLEAELHDPKNEDMIPREFHSMKSQLSNPKDDDGGFKDFKSFRRINVTNSTNGDGNDIFFDEAISRQIEHLGLEERHEPFEKESDVSPQEKRDEMFINNFLEAAIREGQNQPFSATLNNSSSKKIYKEPPGLVPKHTLFSTNSSLTNIPPTFHSAMVLPSGSMPNPVLHSAGYLPAPPKTFNSSKSLGRDSYGEGRMDWGSLPSSFKTLNIDQFEEGKDFNGGYEVNPSNVPNLDKFAHLLSDHKSPVIYVKGLDMYLTNVIMIYNVFSNFGNILKILFIKQKGIAFIEYESVVYSAIAKDSLNNCLFLGTPLKIFYSNYDSLQVRSKQGESFPDEELFIGSPMTTHRFKANKSISINPPSETLHVSNLQIQCCKDDIIRTLFSQYGTIDNLKFIFMENNRNMCLVKYATLEDSFWALANLHNYELGGRKIQISFTRSKI